MRRDRNKQCPEGNPVTTDHRDSPAILNLIEQLDHDLKESEGKASEAH